MKKNILDIYKEKHDQFIILVSGLSSTGKTKLAKQLERDFKLKLIDTKQFMKENNSVTFKLLNGAEIINVDRDDVVDWDKLNNEVDTYKKDGIVIVGVAFPTSLLKFKPDYHIHLKIPKQLLKEKREKFIKDHPEKNYNLENEMLRISALTYPYYVDVVTRMAINKFINIADIKPSELYDNVFDSLIKFIWENIPQPKKKEKEHDTEQESSLDMQHIKDPYLEEAYPRYGYSIEFNDE